MTCEKIYKYAMALIGENPNDQNNNDLLERSVNVINIFILYASKEPVTEITTLNTNFPLSDDYIVACVYYLASVLTNVENMLLSDKLTRAYMAFIQELNEPVE